MNDDKILKKIELLSHILYIEYKGNLFQYNDTELYHDIHRALIEKDYSKDLLKRANEYWDKFKNIDIETFEEMSKQVDNETGDYSWYISLWQLLNFVYEETSRFLVPGHLAKKWIIEKLNKKENNENLI